MKKSEMLSLALIVALVGLGLWLETTRQQKKLKAELKPKTFACGITVDSQISGPYRLYYYADAKTASFVLLDTLNPVNVDCVWDAMNWPNEDKPAQDCPYMLQPYKGSR